MVAVGAASSGSAASAYQRCERGGGNIIQTNPSRTIAIMVNANYEAKEVYLACWLRSGRIRRLGTVRYDERGRRTSTIGGYAFRGPWVVWGQASSNPAGTDTMHSIDVRQGRRGPVVRVPADAMVTPRNGPTPILNELFQSYVAVTSRGHYAWLINGSTTTPDGRYIEALYVPAPDGGDRLVDQGPLDAFRRLWVRGDRVYWLRGGKVRSVKP